MKRSITLYIAQTKVDLEDDTFVVFNYAIENLTNPTIQKNSWSNDINLPKTPTNNKLFGDVFRLDRVVNDGGTAIGADFNPSKKTPFSVYNEAGEIVVSGYCKLNRVTSTSYSVSLYGGLGDFIYGLAYDSEGNKKTLASLDYLGGGDGEMDFNITKDVIKDAWARLGGDMTKSELWDTINFAPAYNGVPDNFEADKALAKAADIGVATSADGYTTQDGYTMISLYDKVDEWAAKDLRSYLQRPVLKMWKLLEAFARSENNGGWSVDLTDINDTTKFPYKDAWITRPLLPGLGTYNQQEGDITITPSSRGTTSNAWLLTYTLADAPGGGTEINFRCGFDLAVHLATSPGQSTMRDYTYTYSQQGIGSIFFIQAVAYDSGDDIVAAGNVLVRGKYPPSSEGAYLATKCGYSPVTLAGYPATYEMDSDLSFSGSGTSFSSRISTAVSGKNISYVEVFVTRFTAYFNEAAGAVSNVTGGATLFKTSGASYVSYAESGCSASSASATATITGEGSLRSGSLITKKYLLTTDKTPADYLLAICKTFGLYILADGATRSARILRRNSVYQNETIDLTGKVDLSKEPEITPLAFDAKWYEFKPEMIDGAFAKEYKEVEGVQYGIQRIDTGYDFDANIKNLCDKGFTGCAAVQDRGMFWNYIVQNTFKPSPFLMAGNKQTLWNNGESKDIDISTPSSSATITEYNDGYDVTSRGEFRDNKNNPVDGSDCLLFYGGTSTMKHFNITDDLSLMDVVAGGACWLFAPNDDGVAIPKFTRFNASRMLDFGHPRQVAIRGFDLTLKSIYEDCWQKYLQDRLSVHGKVFRAKVDFAGVQVNQDLLRKFFWYGGSVWVLNSIQNYSLTTFDPCDCEFIQVREKTNYTNGQY